CFSVYLVFLCRALHSRDLHSFPTRRSSDLLFSIAIAMIISVLFYIALGTLIGLLSKSAVEASVIMLPMFFLFGFGTFIEMMTDISEEHTSELKIRLDLGCRLLLEKYK